MLSIRDFFKKEKSHQPQTYEHVFMCSVLLYGENIRFIFLLQIIQLAAPVRIIGKQVFISFDLLTNCILQYLMV